MTKEQAEARIEQLLETDFTGKPRREVTAVYREIVSLAGVVGMHPDQLMEIGEMFAMLGAKVD